MNPEQQTTINQQLNGKSILITGGTGSFGKAFVERVLKECYGVKHLLVFSREKLLTETEKLYAEEKEGYWVVRR